MFWLDNDVEHLKSWNKMKDRYFLKLLDTGLNNVALSSKPIEDMTERECNAWIKDYISKEHLAQETKQLYTIELPGVSREFPLNVSDYLILPLSLHDNSTLTGTASILEQFGEEFDIPCQHATRNFVFNRDENVYDISAAPKHYEFMLMLHKHRINMVTTEQQIRSSEKRIDGSDSDYSIDSSEGDHSGDIHVETIESTTRYFQQEDSALNKLYDRINGQMLNAMQSRESTDFSKLSDKLRSTRQEWEFVTDHLGRNILHCAVENGNISLVKILLSAGLNINVQEGCGAIPLTIAVLKREADMCKLLVENFASVSGALYSNMPSPIEMAEVMELDEIVTICEHELIENEYIHGIMDDVFTYHTDPTTEKNVDGSENDEPETYNRSVHVQFPTAVVGDQGTCKVTRSTKNRSQAAFKWVAEIPGDLHTKGYLCEAAYKVQKTGVFLYLVNKVMKRAKVTEEAFKSRKFQHQNLSRIQEAVRDGGMALGLTVVYNFKKSEKFPTKEKLDEHLASAGNHNELILQCFKDWLSTSAAKDKSFAYSIQMVDLFAPLLEALDTAVRNGLGTTREALWKLLLPIFAQLQFRNYWTEALVHVVNFTTVWPFAFREMIKRNCSVILSGKDGHDLAMDEFVEEHLVKPLKTYVSGNHNCK